MKKSKILIYTIVVLVALAMVSGLALAEDGLLFRRNVSKTPDLETEKAGIFMMDFYVPAQASTGYVGPVDNYIFDLVNDDGTLADPYGLRYYAKPLFSVYIDGEPIHSFYEETDGELSTAGGIVLGAFDAYVGVSLDDGTSWKTTNISRSADQSSFITQEGFSYPGGVHQLVHQVFNDNIMLAWVSKYCDGGTPLYTLDPESEYIADLETTYLKDAVYLYDLFGVSGDQKSVDYTDQGHPEVGEVPYSCVWTARGKLLAGDDPSTTETEATYVMWTKAERLTSGRRDANLPAVDCAAGAGCMVTWQEDPEGLRPGQGLGPGEGWSGAVAWQQTDIWYSHISQADFDWVFSAEDVIGAITMADYAADTTLTTMPKPYVPMAMPVRLTDNAMCKATNSDPYCYIDFDNIDAIDPAALPTSPATDGSSTFCATQLSWLNPGGTTLNLCVTEDNRLLNGRVASTRVRMNLKPYTPADAVDLDGDGVVEKSAWIIMAAEESKALGDTATDTTEPIDIGKDIWYYSFDPFRDHFMVGQGGMLNQPAQCKFDASADDPLCAGIEEGVFYPVQTDARGFEYYLTEISRRFALTTNSVQAAVDSESGLSAMLIYKQGIINQGGPADIMLRRTLIDDTVFDPAVDNPYAFENMDCDEWVYTDGLNPNYLQGLCLSPAINISGTTIVECTAGTGNDACADTFPVNNDGSNTSGGDFPKVFEWRNCDGVAAIDGCDNSADTTGDLDDQVWENPFDVAKGHRGFLDGDFVMMMYAWSPNWNSNAVGNDHYNLYVRRSFDGGLTWTTTPADLGGAGTTWTENYYGATVGEIVPYEWTFVAGDFEQARNVSQLNGNKITILDPRYTPTGGLKLYPTISTWFIDEYGLNTYGDTLPYEDDALRDPSKFFMIYETGDNTTVAEGEATPLNLYYSRATVYGDEWEIMDYATTADDLVLDRWPWLENKADILSGEAAMLANPGGTFMYTVWNQWEEEILADGTEHVFNSDMPFRRLMYTLDDFVTTGFAPVAYIYYTGDNTILVNTDAILTFIGAGRDYSGTGIQGYKWALGDPSAVVSNEQKFFLPATSLTVGKHTIFFSVVDGNGKWSRVITEEIEVIDPSEPPLPVVNRIFIPALKH